MTETIDQKKDANQTIVGILSDMAQRDPSEITPNLELVGDLHFDSLELVELATELEEAFDLSIPDDAIDKLKTVGKIQTYIAAHVHTT
jgi:acyl carrier protein